MIKISMVLAAIAVSAVLIQVNLQSNACSNFERAWLAENERAEQSGEYELDASEYAAYIGHGQECAGEL